MCVGSEVVFGGMRPYYGSNGGSTVARGGWKSRQKLFIIEKLPPLERMQGLIIGADLQPLVPSVSLSAAATALT